ncbi:hypothetical protein OIU84_028745 [Salix udensis]|uniref:Uncharacterized protein n=1 Tax=Salix udensis TaxID=889485 RepID=A0AAD6KF95_9ROSI|nr:hypothetical protein OIU84_028745 [Salix udensis]
MLSKHTQKTLRKVLTSLLCSLNYLQDISNDHQHKHIIYTILRAFLPGKKIQNSSC